MLDDEVDKGVGSEESFLFVVVLCVGACSEEVFLRSDSVFGFGADCSDMGCPIDGCVKR